MVTRRSLLAACAALAATPIVSLGAFAAGAEDATAFIDKLLRDLIAVVDGPGPIEDKRVALVKIVDATVDLAGVAQFCLGRYWRTATESQRTDYTDLFHRVLVKNVTGKIGEYHGVTYTVGRSTPRDDQFVVSTTINRPGNAPNRVDWLVSTAGGSPKIVDVIAEGVSLRLTQREDYTGFLARNNNNVQALIDAIRQQADSPPT